ncbi:MAG: response regulator, partial [Clostridiaceae bacterium]|nr:response regulator [Clostridiaceae bacterium]
EKSGVELAKEIRRDNQSIQIVFITGYSDYIAEGYDVSALHYLIKPVDQKKLFSVLRRGVEKLQYNLNFLGFLGYMPTLNQTTGCCKHIPHG